MRRLILIISFITFGLLIVGIPNLWLSIRYPQPVEVNYEPDKVAELPTYVKVRGISVVTGDFITGSKKRDTTRLYLPVRPSGKMTGPVALLLASNDPELVEAYTRSGGKQSLAKELKLMAALAGKTEAIGMIEWGGLTTKEKEEMRKLLPDLQADFVVLEEGESPSLSLGMFCLIFAFLFLTLLHWIYKRRKAHQAPPPLSGEPPPLAQ
jgi:hypothetical protein